MKIFLNQIPAGGRTFEEVMTAQDMGLPEDMFVCLSPLAVQAAFQRVGDELLGKVAVHGKYRQTCCRCADDFDVETTECFDLIFDIESGTEFIDCNDDIRQELIVAAALKPVCRDDCKGLCKNCGVNLNREKCQCDK